MRLSSALLFAVIGHASLASFTTAQSMGGGSLLVQAPQNAISCAPALVQWTWTGSTIDALSETVTVSVVPVDGFGKRGSEDGAETHARLIRRRAATGRGLSPIIRGEARRKREVGIRIAGGSNVPLSDGSWTWGTVGVMPGTYRMALSLSDTDMTANSALFTISAGTDMSCLGIVSSTSSTMLPDPTSSASTDGAASTSADGSATSASSPSAITSSLTPANSSMTGQTSAHGQESEPKGSNGGKIAAAVLVPLLAVIGVFAFFYCCRKRQASEARERRHDWSEKALSMLNRERAQPTSGAQHRRNISHPINPIHAAGMTRHDCAVRGEMEEGREGCSPSATRVTAAPGSEHWVDFEGETDACPITSDQMAEIFPASSGHARSTEHGLYKQGSNHVLRDQSDDDSRITSGSSAASSLPAYLREVASPAASFGHDVNGQSLARQRASSSSTETYELSRAPSNASTVTVSGDVRQQQHRVRDLTRSSSNRSVHRKPVPRISVTGDRKDEAAIVSDEHGPFADSHESSLPTGKGNNPSSSQDCQAHVTSMESRLSTQSWRTIGDEQLQEMLLDGASVASRTPRHSVFVDAPESVHASPAKVLEARESERHLAPTTSSPLQHSLLPRRSLTGPMDVDTSDAGSPVPDAHTDAWKLSVRLSDQERGFRVSFPVERDPGTSRDR